MRCQCGGETTVKDTREKGDGVKRRRKCLSCGMGFTTLELPLEEWSRLSSAANRRAAHRDQINRAIEQLRGLIRED